MDTLETQNSFLDQMVLRKRDSCNVEMDNSIKDKDVDNFRDLKFDSAMDKTAPAITKRFDFSSSAMPQSKEAKQFGRHDSSYVHEPPRSPLHKMDNQLDQLLHDYNA